MSDKAVFTEDFKTTPFWWEAYRPADGVTMMTYLGHMVARAIIERRPTTSSAYGAEPLPTRPFYNGNPWFLPAVGSWYQLRDHLDRRIAIARGGPTDRHR